MMLAADGRNAIRYISITLDRPSTLCHSVHCWDHLGDAACLFVLAGSCRDCAVTGKRSLQEPWVLQTWKNLRNYLFSADISLDQISFILLSQQIIHLLITFIQIEHFSSPCSYKNCIPDPRVLSLFVTLKTKVVSQSFCYTVFALSKKYYHYLKLHKTLIYIVYRCSLVHRMFLHIG